MWRDRVHETETGCLEYLGCIMPNGYSKVTISSRTCLGHRKVWEIEKGKIPDGICVLHSCDNRKCINVDHLFLGTNQDNSDDMIKKGRQRFVGLQSPNFRCPTATERARGERSGTAKLSENDVRTIRKLHSCGERQIDIASKFHLRQCHVSRIVRGEAWSHI